MANIFIATIFCLTSFCLYIFSNQIVSVNRIVSTIPQSVFELSVDLINVDDYLYFDQTKLVENVDRYLKDNITQYTSKYEVEYTFLNSEDHSICIDGKCNEVWIDFSATLQFNYIFSRSLSYEIYRK